MFTLFWFLFLMVLFFFLRSGVMLSSLLFFFSSRRRHTRCLSDWSSDVCSSDLVVARLLVPPFRQRPGTVEAGARPVETGRDEVPAGARRRRRPARVPRCVRPRLRSEERRVGKEDRSRGTRCESR